MINILTLREILTPEEFRYIENLDPLHQNRLARIREDSKNIFELPYHEFESLDTIAKIVYHSRRDIMSDPRLLQEGHYLLAKNLELAQNTISADDETECFESKGEEAVFYELGSDEEGIEHPSHTDHSISTLSAHGLFSESNTPTEKSSEVNLPKENTSTAWCKIM
jgi:hypothetical protein